MERRAFLEKLGKLSAGAALGVVAADKALAQLAEPGLHGLMDMATSTSYHGIYDSTFDYWALVRSDHVIAIGSGYLDPEKHELCFSPLALPGVREGDVLLLRPGVEGA